MNKRRIATMMIFLLLFLALLACESATGPGTPYAYPTFTPLPPWIPVPLPNDNPEAANGAAQATLAAGQQELADLSHQATVISLNKNQAAQAAAQITIDYNQRQLMELAIRGTEVSQNMAQAAATQRFIAEQTQRVWDATATAQSQAATATYSAYTFRVIQAAQAQAILDVQNAQTAQADATQRVYALTATPWAAIQADIERTQNQANRRAWWAEFVVNPLRVILGSAVVLLLIVGGLLAYRRLMPVLELRLRTIARSNNSSVLLMDGMTVSPDPPYRRLTRWVLRQPSLPPYPSDETPQVEIIEPSDPSIVNWIVEAEQKLHTRWRQGDTS